MKAVWCVQHKGGWCATKRGRRPDTEAWCDETRCDHFVIGRWGSEKREPTCPECRKRMRLPRGTKKSGSDEVPAVQINQDTQTPG